MSVSRAQAAAGSGGLCCLRARGCSLGLARVAVWCSLPLLLLGSRAASDSLPAMERFAFLCILQVALASNAIHAVESSLRRFSATAFQGIEGK